MSNQVSSPEVLRRRIQADRPSPALPLLLLAAVVLGGIVVALLGDGSDGGYANGQGRLTYWVVAALVAYAAIVLIARHQGYRRGVWVDRRALVTAGVAALVLVALAVLYDNETFVLPGDLTMRGNLPLLAMTTGLLVWAYRERRPGLWVVAGLLVPLNLLANLYNMENLLYRLGVPVFAGADQVVGLGAVAILLLTAAGAFALSQRRRLRAAGRRR